MRVVLLTNMLPPYRIPLFRAINKNEHIDLYVLLEVEREYNRLWEVALETAAFSCSVLRGVSISLANVELHANPEIVFVLTKLNPDALIITGYSSLTSWMSMLWAKTKRIPVVLWSGSTLLSSRYLRGPIYLIRRFFISLADAYVSYGIKATEFLVYHGAPRNKIVTGCNIGDVNFFREATEQWCQSNLGLIDSMKPRFVFAGQLIPRKGILELFKALLSVEDYEWELMVIGDGPSRGELEEFAKKAFPERVQFIGFRQPKDLIPYFGSSDVLLIPSLVEVGSIVMSEGLAAGLYVLASKYDGSTYNLIKEPDNGIIVDPRDQEDMQVKLRYLLTNQPWRGQRSKIAKSIAEFTPDYYANAFIRALTQVIS